jgi:hypothetical protein
MRAALVAGALGLFLSMAPAHATVVVPLSRPQLVERSDLVVRASVVSQSSRWNDDQSQIVTLTRLRVTSYLKGSGSQELVLRQFGGTVEGLTSEIPGDARLAPGQDVVLFLRSGDGVVFLTALSQAAYLVIHSPGQAPRVRRDLHELTFAREQGGRMVLTEPSAEPEETLQQLLGAVSALVRGGQ